MVSLLPTLSPFDIPHVLDRILYYVEQDIVSLLSCLLVCRSWNASASPLRWKTVRKGVKKSDLQPSWEALLFNMKSIHTLHWSLPTSQPERFDQIAQLKKVATQAIRLRSLHLRDHRRLNEVISQVLPLVPRLTSLAIGRSFGHDDGNLSETTPVDLNQILQKAPQLKELHIDFLVAEPVLRFQNAILAVLDLSGVNLTAQKTIGIVSQLPSLLDLRLLLSEISNSLHEYNGIYLESGKDLTRSQTFATDLSKSCPSISALRVHYHPYMSTVPHDSAVALLVRDMVALMASQLLILDVWKTTFHNHTASLLTEARDGARFSLLEKLFIPGDIRNRGPYLTAQSLQRFLRRCETLRVLYAWRTTFDVKYIMTPNSYCDSDVDIQEGRHSAVDSSAGGALSVQHVPAQRLSFDQTWACLGLEYLSLEVASMYPDTNISYAQARTEVFQRCHVFYEQISRLDRLRVAIFRGWMKFPCDLQNSGFYQLEALKQLEIIRISFDWDEKAFHRSESLRSNQEEESARWRESGSSTTEGEGQPVYFERSDAFSTGRYICNLFKEHPPPHLRKTFLAREDIDWMVQSWPAIQWLDVSGWKNEFEPNQGRLQSWVNDSVRAMHAAREELIRASMKGNGESLRYLWPSRTISIAEPPGMAEYLSLDQIRNW